MPAPAGAGIGIRQAVARRLAAMPKTIAFRGDPWFQRGEPRRVLGRVLAVIGLRLHGSARHPQARNR